MENAGNVISKFLFGLVSLLFTGFVFLNTYEVLANADIPLAYSVRKMEDQAVIDNIIGEFEIKPGSIHQNYASRLGGLDYLEIPFFGAQIHLEEARKIKGQWYQRPSLGHYIELNRDSSGNAVDYLIYTDNSWKTIPYPEEIDIGMDIGIYIDKGFSSYFEVSEKKIIPFGKSFIVSKDDDRQILLIVEDAKNNRYYGFSLRAKK